MFTDTKKFEYLKDVRYVRASVSYAKDINCDTNTGFRRRTHNAYFILHRFLDLQFFVITSDI
jgi:hypothetical protein